MLFPSKDSISVEEWASRVSVEREETEESDIMQRIVFIDCTWDQIHPILTCPQIQGVYFPY